MGPRFRNVIFDLDGTLIDSLGGIEASARYAIAKCLPARTPPSLREMVGPPIARMFAQIWPDLTANELEALVAAFREHYDREGCLLSEPYPSVRETLSKLKQNGVVMFVLTNKPLHAARRILEHLDILRYFQAVVSPDSRSPAYSAKHEGARFLQKENALEPARTLVMGDGADDLEAAQLCNFAFLPAAYGYGNVATRLPQEFSLGTAETFSHVGSAVL